MRFIAALGLALIIACSNGTPSDPERTPTAAPADYTVVGRQYVPIGNGAVIRFTIIVGGRERSVDTFNLSCDDVRIGTTLPPRCR